ncbi:MAG: GIY-YIG nuclease family protein [Phycisphaerae bacterium]
MDNQKKFRVYLLLCKDGSLYCGISNDITRRLKIHNAGRGSRYTRSRLPVKLHVLGCTLSKQEALKLEYKIKHTCRQNKVAMLLAAKSSKRRKKADNG